jgi:hypothetical protein
LSSPSFDDHCALHEGVQRAVVRQRAALGDLDALAGSLGQRLAVEDARDTLACERSLAEAYDLLGTGGDDAPSGDVLGHEVTAPYVLAADARCWIWLRPAMAISMFEDVLRGWPRDRTRSRGVQQARLAVACAAAQETERAARGRHASAGHGPANEVAHNQA